MKKSTVGYLIFTVTLLALSCLLIVEYVTADNLTTGIGFESLGLGQMDATQNNGYYNVSLPVSANGPVEINKFVLNPYNASIPSSEQAAGVTAYVNDTRVSASESRLKLDNGDFIQVDFIVPCSDFPLNATIGATIYTPEGLYYKETTLP
jgi:hypothetical protein